MDSLEMVKFVSMSIIIIYGFWFVYFLVIVSFIGFYYFDFLSIGNGVFLKLKFIYIES